MMQRALKKWLGTRGIGEHCGCRFEALRLHNGKPPANQARPNKTDRVGTAHRKCYRESRVLIPIKKKVSRLDGLPHNRSVNRNVTTFGSNPHLPSLLAQAGPDSGHEQATARVSNICNIGRTAELVACTALEVMRRVLEASERRHDTLFQLLHETVPALFP